MPETIEAKELQLMRVFSNDYLFEIPEYQRPYAWTTEQVSELLDDLVFAMGKEESIEEIPPYFLGSIVIIKDQIPSIAKIVDGQQRITTLTILFCVLREISDEKDRDALDGFVREESNRYTGVEGKFRLGVRTRDRAFFRENLQEIGGMSGFLKNPPPDLTDSQQRMFENTKYVRDFLSDISKEEREKLTKFIVQRCYLVVVSASDQSSAYRIFSVMNDRGMDLSPTDILKAEIIGAMDDSIRIQYTEKWEGIEEEIGRDSFRDLFGHIRMIYMKNKARETLNQEFRDGVLNRLAGRNFIDDVLTPFANSYQIVVGANYRNPDDETKAKLINTYLEHLGRLDNDDWVPPAMVVFNQYPYDTNALVRFTRALERLAYGLFIRRANINERISRYGEFLEEFSQNGDLFKNSSSLQLNKLEKAEILKTLDGPVYSMVRVRRPLLLRLDSLLADTGARYDYSTISIEHVLPQNPGAESEWFKLFPDEEERTGWTHRLANLVLLSFYKNVRAQNYDFERKRQEYFQKKGVATFAITIQVLDEPQWTPNVLERRQRYLVNALKEEWEIG